MVSQLPMRSNIALPESIAYIVPCEYKAWKLYMYKTKQRIISLPYKPESINIQIENNKYIFIKCEIYS